MGTQCDRGALAAAAVKAGAKAGVVGGGASQTPGAMAPPQSSPSPTL